jgi:putative serine protease PepD
VSGPPEEPENGDPGRDEGGADPDEPESPLRGWIDPDDRLWRHPSEQVPVVPASGAAAGPVLSPPPKRSFRGPLMVSIGAVAVIAVGAFVYVLLSPASQPPLQSSGRDDGAATLTTDTGPAGAVPPAAQTAAKSVVELQADTAHGTVRLLGVAVAEGGMVATTADLLTGVRSIAMVGAGGKLEQASVVGTDTTSDVALVEVPADLPVAPFADDGSLAGGAPDMVLSLAATSGGNGGLALRGTPGSITAVATSIASGPANGMAAIESSPAMTTGATGATGDPLLDASGSVLGILCDPQASGASTTASAATFLPTQLVVGVADDLRSGNRVVPGWLGVKGSDAAGQAGAQAGAKVDGTYANSPAATHLQAGEVIVAIDAQPVRTFAELRSRLYVEPPGSTVHLSVLGVPGASGAKAVVVTLTSDS